MSGPLSNPFMFNSAADADFYDYQIANSIRYDGSSYMTKTFSGNRRTFTFSTWIKRAKIGTGTVEFTLNAYQGTGQDGLMISTADQWETDSSSGGSGLLSNALCRDPAAWYHVVWRMDTTQSTEANRERVYVNGTEVTYSSSSYPSHNANTNEINNGSHEIGRSDYSNNKTFQGYLADTIFIDGTSYGPDSFGETKNGVWIAKDPSELTFGTTGFWLKYTNSSDFGEDFSGNDNDWSTSGFSASDQMLDSPTFDSTDNGGNFCTINSISRGTSSNSVHYGTLTEGNLKLAATSSQDASLPCTFNIPPAGKWYWEYRIDAGGGASHLAPAMGIINPLDWQQVNGGGYTNDQLQIVYDQPANKVHKGNTETAAYSGSRGSDGDIMAIAVDMDNGAFYMRKEGTWYTISGGDQGDPTSGASKTGAGATWTPASEYTGGAVPYAGCWGGTTPEITCNFGQNGTFNGQETAGDNADANGYGNFYSSVPADYKALCTANLPTPTADPASEEGPNKYFFPKLYTGTGSSNAITGVGFQPDLVWISQRSSTEDPSFYDSSRGVTKRIKSSGSEAESTVAAGFTAFGSDGFTVGSATENNASSQTYVAWCWKGNGGTTTTNDASATGIGDIDSVYQVNTTAGISIVTYSGSLSSSGVATVAHGLDVAPKLVISKDRNYSTAWIVQHQGTSTASEVLELNTTSAEIDKSGNGTLARPTSTVFSTNYTDGLNNASKGPYIAYCFAEKEGFSRFAKYEGNGNANGMFVYTGFRPAFIMTKSVDSTSDWQIFDDQREGYNVDNDELHANDGDAEATTDMIDILSNGFKFRITTDPNVSETYLFLAMAKNPFKYATAR